MSPAPLSTSTARRSAEPFDDPADRIRREPVVEGPLADVALLEVRVVVVDDLAVLVAEQVRPPDPGADRQQAQPGDAGRGARDLVVLDPPDLDPRARLGVDAALDPVADGDRRSGRR